MPEGNDCFFAHNQEIPPYFYQKVYDPGSEYPETSCFQYNKTEEFCIGFKIF